MGLRGIEDDDFLQAQAEGTLEADAPTAPLDPKDGEAEMDDISFGTTPSSTDAVGGGGGAAMGSSSGGVGGGGQSYLKDAAKAVDATRRDASADVSACWDPSWDEIAVEFDLSEPLGMRVDSRCIVIKVEVPGQAVNIGVS